MAPSEVIMFDSRSISSKGGHKLCFNKSTNPCYSTDLSVILFLVISIFCKCLVRINTSHIPAKVVSSTPQFRIDSTFKFLHIAIKVAKRPHAFVRTWLSSSINVSSFVLIVSSWGGTTTIPAAIVKALWAKSSDFKWQLVDERLCKMYCTPSLSILL